MIVKTEKSLMGEHGHAMNYMDHELGTDAMAASLRLGVHVGQEVADTEKTLRIHTFFQTVFLLAQLVVVCWYM